VYFPLENLEQAPVVVFLLRRVVGAAASEANTPLSEKRPGSPWHDGVHRGTTGFIQKITYRDFMHDSAAAVAWGKKERDSNWQKGKPQTRLFVMGQAPVLNNAGNVGIG